MYTRFSSSSFDIRTARSPRTQHTHKTCIVYIQDDRVSLPVISSWKKLWHRDSHEPSRRFFHLFVYIYLVYTTLFYITCCVEILQELLLLLMPILYVSVQQLRIIYIYIESFRSNTSRQRISMSVHQEVDGARQNRVSETYVTLFCFLFIYFFTPLRRAHAIYYPYSDDMYILVFVNICLFLYTVCTTSSGRRHVNRRELELKHENMK